MYKKTKQTSVKILIAPEFDEEMVVHCLHQMRQRGTAVDLVGTPSNLVVSTSGLSVHPDYSLAQLHQETDHNEQLLIIPGGPTCATNLLSDPRVHKIVKRTFKNGGFVATSSPMVSQILTNIGILNSTTASQFLVQGTQSIPQFVKLLISHIIQ
jgi:4-methyl-5(b-hydroxyethyl)-thiazole monophosphate biosynthesis